MKFGLYGQDNSTMPFLGNKSQNWAENYACWVLRQVKEYARIIGTTYVIRPNHLSQVVLFMTTHTQSAGTASLIDTHAHLDFADYEEDRSQVIARAWDAGLVGIVTIGIEPENWSKTLEIAEEYGGIHAAL